MGEFVDRLSLYGVNDWIGTFSYAGKSYTLTVSKMYDTFKLAIKKEDVIYEGNVMDLFGSVDQVPHQTITLSVFRHAAWLIGNVMQCELLTMREHYADTAEAFRQKLADDSLVKCGTRLRK